MARTPLSPDEIKKALSALTGWELSDDATSIRHSFKFADFNAAFAFMTRIAMAAEKLDHHPEWSNVYNKVEIMLTTHSAKGLTKLDVTMAGLINDYARSQAV
ncbi:4a-hydroxytetrahydrobiopterin dehydratase [Pseudochrobactrum sp. MP213Fo]|uniref:4a-hydroxytetrahydrobiopterin dehydratase n=1 Tax=Pseudochrobactrum sp. MP213Fo TaxID=3022250 RepID=UPI003B9FA577